jgi:hypothetical protein
MRACPCGADPYFDEGGSQTLMITYSVPFAAINSFGESLRSTFAITQLVEQITQLKLVQQRVCVPVDRHGAFQGGAEGLSKA